MPAEEPSVPFHSDPLRVTLEDDAVWSGRGVYFDIPLRRGVSSDHDYLLDMAFDGAPSGSLRVHGRTKINWTERKQKAHDALGSAIKEHADRLGPLAVLPKGDPTPQELHRAQEEGRKLLALLSTEGAALAYELFQDFEWIRADCPNGEQGRVKSVLWDLVAGRQRRLLLRFGLVEARRNQAEPPPPPTRLYPWPILFAREVTATEPWEDCLGACFAFRHQIAEDFHWTSVAEQAGPTVRGHAAFDDGPVADPHGVHGRAPLNAWLRHAPATAFSNALGSFPPTSVVPTSRFAGNAFYLFGHANTTAGVPNDNWVQLQASPRDRLTVGALITVGAPVYDAKTVLGFLNGCETTPFCVIDESCFVGRLGGSMYGRDSADVRARAVHRRLQCLTTHQCIPGGVAARFAERFWTAVEAGTPVGLAVYEARHHLAKKYGNPLGLLYLFFGNNELRFA